MKILKITLLLLIISLFSCKKDKDVVPADLEGKKEYLSKKKAELRELQAKIDEVGAEILLLDPPKEKPAIEVNALEIEATEFKRFLKTQGRVVADDVVNASSEMGGRILSLNVKEGQYVQRGALIAVTDMITLEKQIDEIETSLSLAQTVFERQKRLWDQNIGSELQFLEAQTNKERLEKSLETLKSQINKKNVYAPISGYVDKEFLSQGEMASPGMPIVQILNTAQIKVEAELQESLLGKIKRGEYVEIYFPALDKTFKNKITMLGRTIDPANRTFKIEIAMGSQKGQLKPNLLAEILINDFTQKDAISIPINSVQEEVTGKKYIYTVKEEDGKMRAHKTYIELGESAESDIVIELGLNPGDKIITEGAKGLSHNDIVIPNFTNEAIK